MSGDFNALAQFLGTPPTERETRWSTNYVRQDAVAVAGLLKAGMTMGEPDKASENGCTNCWWHLERDGESVDGTSAAALLSNFEQGYYGEAEGLVLRPVMPR